MGYRAVCVWCERDDTESKEQDSYDKSFEKSVARASANTRNKENQGEPIVLVVVIVSVVVILGTFTP